MSATCAGCGKPLDGKTRPGVSLFHGSYWIARLQAELDAERDPKARERLKDFLAAVLKVTP